ncbi:MAG TPA: enoyl-CoA hydratase/isomerase family protein [Solirubrobacteraceae bacterium]|nr:enoyl-CoA hydratase/isomerase family protein [Solirubrobacteraceae bacterium]
MGVELSQDIDVAALYGELTDGLTRQVRIDELLYAAAERVPGLVPTPEEMDAERRRPLADKSGIELAQGLLLARILALPREGTHLLEAMLAPTRAASQHLDEFIATGRVDLGPVMVTREGRAGFLELRNPRHLNAEDCTTLAQTEAAVDLIQMHPEIQLGVLRGGVIDRAQKKYGGQRVFGAGINLTHLYQGKIDFLFYLVRDWGYVNKLFRGTLASDGTIHEKLWLAVVEQFAIGGHCQLLHCMDHVLATRGALLNLPARKEGIIPGASNLRLPRFVGDRAARQAILAGREWRAGEPDAEPLVDEVVEPGEVEEAMRRRISALTDSGLVSAVGNRRMIRIGAEPPDVYRQYMSAYAREQALCHLSPALIDNLERHWDAHNRSS